MAAPRARNRRRRSNGIGCSEGLAVIRADNVARSIGGVCQICWAGRDGGSCDILACGVVGMVQSPHEWVAVWWDGSDGSDSSDVRKGQFRDFLLEFRYSWSPGLQFRNTVGDSRRGNRGRDPLY